MPENDAPSLSPLSHPDPYEASEALFLRQREDLLRQLKQCDELLANIRAAKLAAASTGSPHITPPRQNEYKGMKATEAAAAYLKARRGIKVPLSRLVADLVSGGVSVGAPRGNVTDPESLVTQNLKIALPNAGRIFEYDPVRPPKGSLKGIPSDQITVWLAPTADQVKKRKPVKLARAKSA